MKIESHQQQDIGILKTQGVSGKEQKTRNKDTGNKGTGVKNGSISRSELNLSQDDIFNKKKKAQKDAMNLIQKQFQTDGLIDKEFENRREYIARSKEDMQSANEQINDMEQKQKQLQKEYEVDPDSQEQKDLELLIKKKKADTPLSGVRLTEEEQKRLEEMGPETEYQTRMMEYEDSKDSFRNQAAEARKNINIDSGTIKGMKLEMLKYHGMTDAEKAAGQTLKEAGHDVLGMLVQEARDQIEEEQKEAEEKAEGTRENQAQKETVRKEEKTAEANTQKQVKNMSETEQSQEEIEEKIKQLLEKQKLLDEDLKGIKVNTHG